MSKDEIKFHRRKKDLIKIFCSGTMQSTLGNRRTHFRDTAHQTLEAMYTIQVGLKTFKFANGTLLSPMMAGATIGAVKG